jgi:flagellar protein FliO/FliZ
MLPLSSVLKMGGALALVLGVVLLTAYLAKRFLGARLGMWRSEPLIRVLATTPLGSRREIAVVEVGGKHLVVGVTASQITLLAQLDESSFPVEASREIPEA